MQFNLRIIKPKPFTFESGPRAVLLLHGFTGNSADVRMLGRYLEKHNYTSHAPIYRGHGLPPEELIKATPEEWWEDVQAGLAHLKELGYEEIAVAGLSLGGVLGLKLAYCTNVKAIITMCSPMSFDNEQQLTAGFELFAREYKQLERKDKETIDLEVDELLAHSNHLFENLGNFIAEVKDQVNTIYTPTMVVQARKDKMITIDSAPFIYNNVESETKEIKWYEKSGHAITLDVERDQLHIDVHAFLDSLEWGND